MPGRSAAKSTVLLILLVVVLSVGSVVGRVVWWFTRSPFVERALTETYVEVIDRESGTSSIRNNRTGATLNPSGVKLVNVRLHENLYILADIHPDQSNARGVFCVIRATGMYRYFRDEAEFRAFTTSGGG